MNKYIKITFLFCFAFLSYFCYLFYEYKQDQKCNSLMYEAIYKFENKEYKLALEGDDNLMGFLTIIDRYKHINSDNIIYLYTGLCYSHLNDYENAIKFLSLYKTNSIPLLNSLYICIGDLYCNLNNTTKSIEYYHKVNNSNSETKALALVKLVDLYVRNKNYSNAKEIMTILRSLYYQTEAYKKISKEQRKLSILFD